MGEKFIRPNYSFTNQNSFPMEPQSDLDTKGDLQNNSAAELLAEISLNNLNGSLRAAHDAQKIVFYFDAGELIFAVSNARRHRLFEMLLEAGKISQDRLRQIPNAANDLALRDYLLKNNLLEETEISRFFSKQISEILQTIFTWREGEWTFSPLVRIKGDIKFPVNVSNLLAEYARHLNIEEVEGRFKDSQESFRVKTSTLPNIVLTPSESFVFSRFENAPMTIETVQTVSGLPEAETRRILYVLWLGGLLVRANWKAAFSERKIAAILSARLALRKDDQPAVVQPSPNLKTEVSPPIEAKTEEIEAKETVPAENEVSLTEYLERIEQASTFYEIFALAPDAAAADIKQVYFSLAKRFHPDLFHKEADTERLQKIQSAFTQLAQAYDTLKTPSSREVYDFRMRKELAEIKAVQSKETTYEDINSQKQLDQAAEHFEMGFNFLIEGNTIAAVPFLARATHFDSGNARYHAYYGKALAADTKQRHKAEGELQTAVKLDSTNGVYRIILAEFFIQFNLLKRAEGELKRLLTIHPNNAEAQALLDSLPKK